MFTEENDAFPWRRFPDPEQKSHRQIYAARQNLADGVSK
jgi:hypothetical protein